MDGAWEGGRPLRRVRIEAAALRRICTCERDAWHAFFNIGRSSTPPPSTTEQLAHSGFEAPRLWMQARCHAAARERSPLVMVLARVQRARASMGGGGERGGEGERSEGHDGA